MREVHKERDDERGYKREIKREEEKEKWRGIRGRDMIKRGGSVWPQFHWGSHWNTIKNRFSWSQKHHPPTHSRTGFSTLQVTHLSSGRKIVSGWTMAADQLTWALQMWPLLSAYHPCTVTCSLPCLYAPTHPEIQHMTFTLNKTSYCASQHNIHGHLSSLSHLHIPAPLSGSITHSYSCLHVINFYLFFFSHTALLVSSTSDSSDIFKNMLQQSLTQHMLVFPLSPIFIFLCISF